MAIFLYLFALARGLFCAFAQIIRAPALPVRASARLCGINARAKICVPLINNLPGKNCLAGKK